MRNWVGDVWKAILKLRAQHADLETCVLNCDHGIGLVYRAQNRSGLSLTSEQIDAMVYSDFAGDAWTSRPTYAKASHGGLGETSAKAALSDLAAGIILTNRY